jgi:hypothetical protein
VNELVAFLNARLDDEEQAANNSRTLLLIVHADRCSVPGSAEEATFRHFERYPPKRALAEVDAKRRMLAWLAEMAEWAKDNNTWYDETEPLKLLALPHVGHPDFREEWRP